MNWLSSDSRFMQAWANMIDGVIINIYMLITSLPLITIGASLSAGNVAARKTLQGEGKSVTYEYFTAFARNFVQSTLLWIPYFITGLGIAASWIFLQIPELLIIKFALSIVWVIGFEWVFALQARFENNVGATLKNSFIFGISNIGYTVGLIAIDMLLVILAILTALYMKPALFLIVVFGYGSMLMLHIPLTERVFKRYGA